jgi:hypothetical protein
LTEPASQVLVEITEKRDARVIAKILGYVDSLIAVVMLVCTCITVVGCFSQNR